MTNLNDVLKYAKIINKIIERYTNDNDIEKFKKSMEGIERKLKRDIANSKPLEIGPSNFCMGALVIEKAISHLLEIKSRHEPKSQNIKLVPTRKIIKKDLEKIKDISAKSFKRYKEECEE